MYLGSFSIDDYVGIPATTHNPASGTTYTPSSLAYSIYEEETTTGIDENVSMVPGSPFDGVTGCYWIRRQLTVAAGFEAGKNYMILIRATVKNTVAIQMHTFQVAAKVDARYLGGMAQTGRDIGASVLLAGGQLIFKKNVARANFAFPMFDTTGALKTDLTVTAEIRKDAGAGFAALAGAVSEIGSTGWYTVDFAQAETNADTIAFSASAAGSNPTCFTIFTQA